MASEIDCLQDNEHGTLCRNSVRLFSQGDPPQGHTEALHLHAAGGLGLKEGVVHLLHMQVQLVCGQQQVPT